MFRRRANQFRQRIRRNRLATERTCGHSRWLQRRGQRSCQSHRCRRWQQRRTVRPEPLLTVIVTNQRQPPAAPPPQTGQSDPVPPGSQAPRAAAAAAQLASVPSSRPVDYRPTARVTTRRTQSVRVPSCATSACLFWQAFPAQRRYRPAQHRTPACRAVPRSPRRIAIGLIRRNPSAAFSPATISFRPSCQPFDQQIDRKLRDEASAFLFRGIKQLSVGHPACVADLDLSLPSDARCPFLWSAPLVTRPVLVFSPSAGGPATSDGAGMAALAWHPQAMLPRRPPQASPHEQIRNSEAKDCCHEVTLLLPTQRSAMRYNARHGIAR